jgi:hypothetical protein
MSQLDLTVLTDAAQSQGAVEGVSSNDFYAYMPMHTYIFSPSREMWPPASVNARIPPIPIGDKKINASTWLDQNKPVEQMTWAPGEPMVIRDRLVSNGGWIERQGVAVFNLYLPPTNKRGNPALAGPWIEHGRKLYGDEFDHILNCLAHRAYGGERSGVAARARQKEVCLHCKSLRAHYPREEIQGHEDSHKGLRNDR